MWTRPQIRLDRSNDPMVLLDECPLVLRPEALLPKPRYTSPILVISTIQRYVTFWRISWILEWFLLKLQTTCLFFRTLVISSLKNSPDFNISIKNNWMIVHFDASSLGSSPGDFGCFSIFAFRNPFPQRIKKLIFCFQWAERSTSKRRRISVNNWPWWGGHRTRANSRRWRLSILGVCHRLVWSWFRRLLWMERCQNESGIYSSSDCHQKFKFFHRGAHPCLL